MTTHSKAQRLERELVSGWLYQPDGAPIAAMALFHGAGSNCESPLLIAVAEAFRDAGWLVFRVFSAEVIREAYDLACALRADPTFTQRAVRQQRGTGRAWSTN